MKQATTSIIVTLVLASATFAGDDPYLRYATGWPDNQAWVENAAPMDGYDEGAEWGTTAFQFIVAQPTMITSLAGVGGNPGVLTNATPIINVYSSLTAFAANSLVGDIHTQTGSLVTTTPPPFGFMGAGFQNNYYEYKITPFLLDPGTYFLSVYHTNAGQFWYAESTNDLGSDFSAIWSEPGVILNYADDLGYATGTVAIDVRGHPVATDVPTVSEWGVAVMTLLLLTAGTIVYTKRHPLAA
jgi:hypothetical protein